MKMVIKTRWEYYVANIAGIVAILGLLIWSVSRSVTAEGINYQSILFWVALLLLVSLPFAIISFFSSMKAVEVTKTGLIISYVFQNHKNNVEFADIVAMKSSRTETETRIRPRTIRDSFRLVLVDGRVFEFDRSQFTQYDQLKTMCRKNLKVGNERAPAQPSSGKKRGR